jgi:hypothetical protein
MKPDYITLSDGRKVRIEWNMNALGEFTSATGKEMTDLTGGKADVKTLRTIAWCSAVEGEAADGKELGLTELEFGRLMTMASIVAFSEILTRQSTGAKKNELKKRFPLIHFRQKD